MRLRLTVGTLLLWSVASVVEAGATPIIAYDGSTLGCYNSPCSTSTDFASPVTLGGLMFTGGSFAGTIDANTTETDDLTFGSFFLDRGTAFNYGGDTFSLLVSLTIPSIVGATFTATLAGNVTSTNGTLNINFDHTPQMFNFADTGGAGTFELLVPGNVQYLNNPLTSGSKALTGRIQNVTYTPTVTPTNGDPAVVPEPASLLLLGTGLFALARRYRRRAA